VNRRRETGVTSFQIPGGRSVLIDNRIGADAADTAILTLARRGAEESYTVISDRLSTDPPDVRPAVPKLHICILLRPGKRSEHAGIFGAIATLAACHAIERNSDHKTSIRWLGGIYSDRRRIAKVSSECMLLPSGYLDYLILRTDIELSPTRFPTRMTDTVTRIFTARHISTADHVAQVMVHDFFSLYDSLGANGAEGTPFWEEYKRRSLLLGKRVKVRIGGKRRTATASDIDALGRLCVTLRDGKTVTLTSQAQLLS